MATISRRLPKSDQDRLVALNTALNKNNITPPGTGPLTANTIARLVAMVATYISLLTARATAKAQQTTLTPQKDAVYEILRRFISHFIQVFNLGVARGKYPAADRSYYQIPVSSAAVPNLDQQDNANQWASNLITGDPLRVAAGGAAMANPDIAEVEAAFAAAGIQYNAHNLASEALDNAEEAVANTNPEADSLIKRIWDEVETFYGEEEASSKRENSRRWGVVYVSEGPLATLTGLVKNTEGNPVADIIVTLLQTGATATTNAEGRYSLQTNLIGTATLTAHGPDDPSGIQIIQIPEHTEAITIEVDDITY